MNGDSLFPEPQHRIPQLQILKIVRNQANGFQVLFHGITSFFSVYVDYNIAARIYQ